MKRKTVFELAHTLQQEELQARSIMNAYRQVQQLKPISIPHTTTTPTPHPPSSYITKVKETLRQLNANKLKQCKPTFIPPPQPKTQPTNKLTLVGVKKLTKTIDRHIQYDLITALKAIEQVSRRNVDTWQRKTNNFRTKRIFQAWRGEIVLMKIQKKRQQEEKRTKDHMAWEYRKYWVVKMGFKGWKKYITYRKMKEAREVKEAIVEKKAVVVGNSELQGKLRGFLDSLKQKIENKHEGKEQLEVIKEQKEQNKSMAEESNLQIQIEHQQSQIQPTAIQPTIQPTIPTNQQLYQKRRLLQQRYKTRKQTLQTLKKQKQQKKLQQEQKRLQLQRQIESQQKRLKQQQYKQYLMNKQLTQQQQLKIAQFNRKRLLFYYGFHPLQSAPLIKRQTLSSLLTTLTHLTFRIHSVTLFTALQHLAHIHLDTQYCKYRATHAHRVKKQVLLCITQHVEEVKEENAAIAARRELKVMAMCVTKWNQIVPTLKMENNEWERPRNRQADLYRRINLLAKALKSIQTHTSQEVKRRELDMHKMKIKKKIQQKMQSQDDDYSEYL